MVPCIMIGKHAEVTMIKLLALPVLMAIGTGISVHQQIMFLGPCFCLSRYSLYSFSISSSIFFLLNFCLPLKYSSGVIGFSFSYPSIAIPCRLFLISHTYNFFVKQSQRISTLSNLKLPGGCSPAVGFRRSGLVRQKAPLHYKGKAERRYLGWVALHPYSFFSLVKVSSEVNRARRFDYVGSLAQ